MKNTIIALIVVVIFYSCNQKNEDKTVEKSNPVISYDKTQDKANDFYDDEEPLKLSMLSIINHN